MPNVPGETPHSRDSQLFIRCYTSERHKTLWVRTTAFVLNRVSKKIPLRSGCLLGPLFHGNKATGKLSSNKYLPMKMKISFCICIEHGFCMPLCCACTLHVILVFRSQALLRLQMGLAVPGCLGVYPLPPHWMTRIYTRW